MPKTQETSSWRPRGRPRPWRSSNAERASPTAIWRSSSSTSGGSTRTGPIARRRGRCSSGACPSSNGSVGPNHPSDGDRAVVQLGVVLTSDGDFVQADAVLHRALAIQEKALGPDDPDLGRTLRDLGSLLERRGDLTKAEEMDLRALAILEKAEGRARLQAGDVLNNLGVIYLGRRDYQRAGEYLERALPLMEATYGADSIYVASDPSEPGHRRARGEGLRQGRGVLPPGPGLPGKEPGSGACGHRGQSHQPRERLPLEGRLSPRARDSPSGVAHVRTDRGTECAVHCSCRSSTWRGPTPSWAICRTPSPTRRASSARPKRRSR